MAIDLAKQHVVVLTITDDSILPFMSLLGKLVIMSKKSGFRKDFTTEEIELINELNNNTKQ